MNNGYNNNMKTKDKGGINALVKFVVVFIAGAILGMGGISALAYFVMVFIAGAMVGKYLQKR